MSRAVRRANSPEMIRCILSVEFVVPAAGALCLHLSFTLQRYYKRAKKNKARFIFFTASAENLGGSPQRYYKRAKKNKARFIFFTASAENLGDLEAV